MTVDIKTTLEKDGSKPTTMCSVVAFHLHLCMVRGALRHLEQAPSIYTLYIYLSVIAY